MKAARTQKIFNIALDVGKLNRFRSLFNFLMETSEKGFKAESRSSLFNYLVGALFCQEALLSGFDARSFWGKSRAVFLLEAGGFKVESASILN